MGLPETWNFTGIRSGYVFLILKHILVSGFNHLEKYQSMGRIIPYIIESKKCSKPPSSI
jgi:hypothetical protein